MSRAMKSRIAKTKAERPQHFLHQFPSDHVERLLSREPANALTVARKVPLDNFRSRVAGQGMKNQPDRFLWCSARWPGNAGDADAERGPTAFAYAFGQSHRHQSAHRAILYEKFLRHAGKLRLQFIRVNNRASQKIARTAAYGRDSF